MFEFAVIVLLALVVVMLWSLHQRVTEMLTKLGIADHNLRALRGLNQ
jgi:hypothetical protein